MSIYLKLNPLLRMEHTNQSITIKNTFGDDKIFELKSKNAEMFYKFINKFNGEENNLEEIINEYEEPYHQPFKKFVDSLMNTVFLIKYSKNDYFFSTVLEKIKQMIQSDKNVNFQQLARILVNRIPNIKACVIHDEENESYIGEFNKYYFNTINHCNLDKLDSSQIENHLINNDLYIILINHSSFDKLEILNKHIKNSDKTVILMQHSNNKISIGPLLMSNVLGCVHCLKLALMDVRNIESIKYQLDEKGSDIVYSLINSYLYDEILNFYIDKISNYSTSYCKLLGNQLTFDLAKNNVYKINTMKDPKCSICY